MNRREFLFSAGAVTMLSGCRSLDLFGSPELTFGVVSDIHVTTPKSCAMFERALRQFRRRGVDAVVVPGDLTDWGLKSGLRYVKETWERVFGGTDVVPLLCTGNHDYDGWGYGDMTMEMHANGYSEADRMAKDLGAAWEDVLGEKFANVRCRTVKGFDFVSCEYGARKGDDLKLWMEANAGRFRTGRPFFFFQHLPIAGTTGDSAGRKPDKGDVKSVLDAFPNCVAFTGHTHRPFIDERQIWQGAFTAVGVPSLSYASLPGGHENGGGARNGTSKQAMPPIPTRRDLRGGEGYVVGVWTDKVVIERRDVEEDDEGAPEWLIPLCGGQVGKPFADAMRGAREPVPRFPADARIDLETRNADNRAGFWTIVMNCTFPSAVMPAGHRVFDYEVRAVPTDGSASTVKRYFSPAYPKMAKYEPAVQRFWLDVAELPQDKDYRIEVRARNCFSCVSEPLVSSVLRGRPGLGKVDRSL